VILHDVLVHFVVMVAYSDGGVALDSCWKRLGEDLAVQDRILDFCVHYVIGGILVAGAEILCSGRRYYLRFRFAFAGWCILMCSIEYGCVDTFAMLKFFRYIGNY
jgi:hypothetical protein